MKTDKMTPAEYDAWLAGWSPPFCVTCEEDLTAAERDHPRNNGAFDETCDACAARERTPTPPPPAQYTVDLRVRLTEVEIASLQTALEHVRAYMAHQHPWEIREHRDGGNRQGANRCARRTVVRWFLSCSFEF